MNKYYYKLVCIDDTNPLGLQILEDKNFDTLESVHDYVTKHLEDHIPELSKWALMPFKKDCVDVKPA